MTAHTETPRSERPLPLRLFNGVGRHLGADGRAWISLDPDKLVRNAEEKTGLHDWGGDSWREALQQLTHSFEREARLNLFGRIMVRQYLDRILANRLKIQQELKAHPEILDIEIRKPLVIVGLPRTGSTLTQRLLARDPGARSLMTWEMMHPIPPPRPETYLSDPRIRGMHRRLKLLDWAAPDFMRAHEVVAGEPEECISLMQGTLQSITFEILAYLPGYRAWLATQDMRASYRDYKRQLQLLQSQYDKHHWVLKSPFHMWGLEALMEVFPDARVVQTHRSPVSVMPSLCSLFSAMYTLTSDEHEPRQIGAMWLDDVAAITDHIIDLRDRIGDDRFIDVSYRDMVSDPIGIAESIYQRFGMELGEDARRAMRDWLAANPQHKRGVHRYTLDEFGLSEPAVTRAFARYFQRFGQYL
jgi:hypothetical protein